MLDMLKLTRSLWPIKTKFDLIRMGANQDGGYLIPDDLEGISTCFSPGVGDIASFESDLLKRGIKSHLCDGSVVAPPGGVEFASFTNKFIGVVDNDNTMTLETWVKTNAPEGEDLILQMDIENYEFPTIVSTPFETLKRFRIIVIEVHFANFWALPLCAEFVQAFFDKLLTYFYVVHSHPNNNCNLTTVLGVELPEVFELTFLRKDRATPMGYVTELPHPLDAHNSSEMLPFDLPKSMYSHE